MAPRLKEKIEDGTTAGGGCCRRARVRLQARDGRIAGLAIIRTWKDHIEATHDIKGKWPPLISV